MLMSISLLCRIMDEYLRSFGLDGPYWTAIFSELKVTAESFGKIKESLLSTLLQKARNDDEKVKIVTFILEMKDKTTQEKPSEDDLDESLLPQECDYTPDSMLALTKEWHMDDLTVPEIQERLQYLLKVKEDVISKTKNQSLWIQKYLAQPLILQYLVAFIQLLKSVPEENVIDIMSLLQQLIEKPEIPAVTEECPQLAEFTQWLYKPDVPPEVLLALNEVKDLCGLVSFLKSIVSSKKISQRPDVNYAKLVSEGVEKLRSIYHHTYNEIFLIVLTSPYLDSERNLSWKSLSLDDVENLLNVVMKEILFFHTSSSNEEAHQAYLLFLAAGNTLLVQQVLHLFNSFQLCLMPSIASYANQVLDHSSSVNEIQRKLKLLYENKISSPQFKGNKQEPQQLTCKYINDPEGSVDAHPLLHRLNLYKYYPKKLHLQDALRIKQEPLTVSLSGSACTPEKLPSVILHKLMSNDSRCRSDTNLVPKFPQGVDEQSIDEDEPNESSGIHPMDCLLAIFLCCDDFLLQDLFYRLAKCQLAVPFLLADPFTEKLTFPLWAMRSIVKEFFLRSSKGDIIQKTCPIVKYPMKIVSFLRLGAQQQFGRSKSNILNQVISGGDNDHFFHYDLPGGQHPCVLGSGLVDMCWYLPSGKTTDVFPEALTFLNLHGDARFYTTQCQVLGQVSSVCFAVITENIVELKPELKAVLNSLYESDKLTFLNASNEEPIILKAEFKKSKTISLKKNAAQINNSIQTHIISKLEKVAKKSIESLSDCFDHGILIDESSEPCVQGKILANTIRDTFLSISNNKRDIILPLQGKTWKDWASADKELYRVTQKGNLTVEKYVEKVKQKKKSIRQQQLHQIEKQQPLLQNFVTSLRKLQGPENFMERNFFLQFLKQELNYLSQISISEKQHQFKLLRIEKQEMESDKSHSKEAEKAKLDQMSKKLVSLQEDILETSFGLEHILRELGQIYECTKLSKRHIHEYSDLPEIVAELLIDGYPVEIMDGDAAHVPLQWVMDVLKVAERKLSNPKIFVFSVLGIQSSGKSTMLNTIFGLQFNVSAGRCTRGAFMQLLQLDDQLKKKTKCSYVLIVDTEGLKAPELDSLSMQRHDNELATFVIGLANMTFINIYGEVTGDIDDILQTSVHAFLRMSEVRNFPSCKFVHQNAGLNVNCEVGRVKLTEKLNKFAAAAAKEEEKKDVNSFKDVINFNDTKDVHFFPGLWKGEPPMAPVDRGYSEAAQVMKQHVIDILLERGRKSTSTKTESGVLLSDFRTRVSDLWKSLLKENFVFSFRNTMEISYYNELETAYNKWEWKFQESMLLWQQKAENEIRTEPLTTLDQKAKIKLIDLQKHISRVYDSTKEEMDKYFEKNDILAQWKATFDIKFEKLKNEMKAEAENHCKKLEESRKRISEFEQKKEKYTVLVMAKVQEHIEDKKREQHLLQQNLEKKCLEPTQLSSLIERKLFVSQKLYMYKDKKILDQKDIDTILVIVHQYGNELTEEGLKRILVGNILKIDQIKKILESHQDEAELLCKFNEFWSDCIKIIPPSHPSSSGRVRDEVERSLISYVGAKGNSQIVDMLKIKRFEEWDDGTISVEEKQGFTNMVTKIVKGIGVFGSYFSPSQPQHNSDAAKKDLKDKVNNKVKRCMQEFYKQRTDYSASYTVKILNAAEKVLDSNQHLLSLVPPNYRYVLYCTVCSYAVKKFEEMADLFHEQNDPRLYLEKYVKGLLYTKFKNTYRQIKAEEGISDTLCAYLEEPIRAQVHKLLSVEMVTQMKDSDHLFSNKMALKVKVLLDLHVEGNFQSYMSYLGNVKKYLKDKLENYTIAFCNEQSPSNSECTRLQYVAKNKASQLIRLVRGIVHELVTTDIQSFLVDFNEKARVEIGATLPPKDVLSEYDALESVNLSNLKKNFLSKLENLEVKLHDSLNRITCKEEMKHWGKKPHELLQRLIGCTEQCPFCGEQCDLLQPDHECDHRVEIHRVDCLTGYKWKDTKVMTTHFCQVSVSSELLFRVADDDYHPYKEYKTIYPRWEITPDKSSEASLYWKWFVGKYYKQLAETYQAKPADVPEEWFHIDWPEIEQNLYMLYNFRKD